MPKHCPDNPAALDSAELTGLLKELNHSYADHLGVNLKNDRNLPGRQEVLTILAKLSEVIFPGFDDSPRYPGEIDQEISRLLTELNEELYQQIARAFRFVCTQSEDCEECDTVRNSAEAARNLLLSIPAIRESMKWDVKAAYAGDPAATSYEEIILSYPCIKAIAIQRIAHVLYHHAVPFIPRMMTECAHAETGIDIHPGTHLGRGIFIDHGTGVVIGETARIGDNVRIYQGVTLGALSFPKDACGMLIKGQRRHPTVESDVTIYAGATILGDIVIGAGSVIGGNVWVTESLPPGTKITARPPEQQVRLAKEKKQ